MALVDAAWDFMAHNHDETRDVNGFLHGSGLRGHRLPNTLYGGKYLQDLAAVMNDLRGRYPSLPLWAVGTSQGTISAAVAAANVESTAGWHRSYFFSHRTQRPGRLAER